MLIGNVPADGTVVFSSSPPPRISNHEIELLPALTANRSRRLSLSTTAPCEPSPPPLPVPPVGNDPAGVSVPSAARENASTAVPAGEFERVKTVPAELRAPVAAVTATSIVTASPRTSAMRFMCDLQVSAGRRKLLQMPLLTGQAQLRY